MKIDSTVFSTSIAAEVAELNAKLLALCQNEFETESKWFHIGPEEYRKKRAEGLTAFPKPVHLPRAKNIEIPSRDEGRNIKLRCFIPEGKILGIYLHMHGGGWVLSDAAAQDPYLSRLSESGMIAASIEYRLAPENPSPAAQDDCFDVAHYLLSPSSMSVFAQSAAVRKNIILGGESAGGHLALSTIISLQKKHRQSVAGVILNYGFYDLSLTPSARNCTAPLVLNNRDLEEFVKAYLPNKHKSISELQRPEHSPLYADLHGLCPAFFSCGTVDPLLDDTLFTASRYTAASNEARVELFPGAPHERDSIPTLKNVKVGGEETRFATMMTDQSEDLLMKMVSFIDDLNSRNT